MRTKANIAGKQVLESTEGVPAGATHLRRPEYLTAWRYDKGETIPEWLVEKYRGNPLPDHRLGLVATAIDGEFWRWLDADKFNEMYVAISEQCP